MTLLRPTLIDDSQAARLNALAMLPETTLVSLIAEKSRAMDASWMETFTQAGVLAFPPLDAEESIPEDSMKSMMKEWSRRLVVCSSFLSTISSKDRNENPIPGTKNERLDIEHIAALESTTLFKEWFTAAAKTVTSALLSATQSSVWQFDGAFRGRTTRVGGEWLMAACALDLPEVVKDLLQSCPHAPRHEVPHTRLGQFLNHNTMAPSQIGGLLVNASFVALQLSRVECLRVLQDAALEASGKLVLGCEVDERGRETTFGLFEGKFTPVCDQTTFGVAVELAQRAAVHHPEERALLEECALQALRDNANVNTSSYVPSFTAAGVYREVGFPAAEVACKTGHLGVVQSLAGVLHWSSEEERQSALIPAALGSFNEGNRKNIVGAVTAFSAMAVAEGAADAIFTVDGKVRDDTVNFAVGHQAVDLLVKMLEHTDLKPSTVVVFHGGERASLMAYASGLKDQRVANMLRSWQARHAANDLLQEMDLASTPAPPKP